MSPTEQPKQPKNPYWLWLDANREALIKEAGTGKGSVVGKLGGEKWRAIDAATKDTYEKKAAVVKAEYEAAMKTWQAAGGVPAKRKPKDDKKEAKRAKREKREQKDPNLPKKAPNAYWLWLADNRAAIVKETGTGAAGVVGKLAGERWNGLPADAKAPYEAKSAALKAEYLKALEEYKKKSGKAEEGGGDDDGSDNEGSENGDDA